MDTVLFVDDDQGVLNSVGRLFLDTDIRILKAVTTRDALEILSREEIAVVVTDNLMPGMEAIDLLKKIKDISPDTFKILITAHADLDVAVDAINSGEVFRFIVKPWQNDLLITTVMEALEQYKTVCLLKSSDEKSLLSLAQAVEFKDGYTRGHCERVAEYSLIIAAELNLSDDQMRSIRHGSWLHDCGKIGVPENILNKKGPLDHEEFEIIKNHPAWGFDMAKRAAMSESVINIIHHHHERYDGTGYPSGLKAEEIPFEARIITVADVYDALSSDRPYRKKFTSDKTMEIMRVIRGSVFDPDIFDVFMDMYAEITK